MNSRRSFFKQLIMGAASFAILPPATTYERLWKAQRQIVLPPSGITCAEFRQWLVNEVPRFDTLILKEYGNSPAFITGRWEGVEQPDTRLIKACDFLG